MFIDYAEIFIKAGNGGDGAVAFRKEKFVPKGGPSGGNGGDGGNVVFKSDRNLHTLLDFRYKKKYFAENGKNGQKSLKDGKKGTDLIIKLPLGTLLKDKNTGNYICDLDEDGIKYTAAKGGKGGKGNSNFATSTNQVPRYAEKGTEGEKLSIILELKLIADVGLVGLPNAGKSTLISKLSAARPKIADYPFTTLKPNLGIVKYKDFDSFTIADIPGIIEDAHKGKGLGLQFLRHIERTELLLLMIDSSAENIEKDFEVLLKELSNYSEILDKKRKIVGLTKADLLTDKKREELKTSALKLFRDDFIIFSAVSGYNVNELLDFLWKNLHP